MGGGASRLGERISFVNSGFFVLVFVILYSIAKAGKVFFPGIPGFSSTIFFVLAFFSGCMPAIAAIFSKKSDESVRKGTVWIIFLIAALITPLIFHRIFLVDQQDFLGRSPLNTAMSLSLFAVAWLIIGASLQIAELQRSNLLAIAVFAILLALVLPSLGEELVIDYRRLNAGRADGLEFDHLVLGETVPLLIFFAFAVAGKGLKFVAIGLGVFVLFALGGRTALFAIVPTLVAFYAIRRQLSSYLPVLAVLLGVPLFAAFIVFADVIFQSSALSRMLIVGGLEEENSFVLRADFFAIGLQGLSGQVLFGDPTFLVERLGSVGTYMHNILSAWQFWGAFTFFYIVSCSIFVLICMWRKPDLTSDPIGEFVLVTFLYGVVCVLSGKHVGFDLFWLGLGMGLARISNSKQSAVVEDGSSDPRWRASC